MRQRVSSWLRQTAAYLRLTPMEKCYVTSANMRNALRISIVAILLISLLLMALSAVPYGTALNWIGGPPNLKTITPYLVVFVSAFILAFVSSNYLAGSGIPRVLAHAAVGQFLVAYVILFYGMSKVSLPKVDVAYAALLMCIAGAGLFSFPPFVFIPIVLGTCTFSWDLLGPGVVHTMSALNIIFFGIVAICLNLLRFMSALRSAHVYGKLTNFSYTDALTGMYNMRALFRDIEGMTGEKLLVAAFDIDDFKHFNDTYGHDRGDKALAMFASILGTTFRDEGACYRVGGDEFLVLAPRMTEERYQELVNEVSEVLSVSHLEGTGSEQQVSISFTEGHTIGTPMSTFEIHELNRKADRHMYRHKTPHTPEARGANAKPTHKYDLYVHQHGETGSGHAADRAS